MPKFAIIDIETSGSYSASPGITEVAVVVHDGERVVETFETLVDPGGTVLPFVTRLTGITNEMVMGAPKFEEVAKRIGYL